MKSHSVENPYYYDFSWNKYCITGNYPMRRMNGHHSNILYHCGPCWEGFISRNKIKVHMKSHIRENPYYCGLCGKGFISFNHLKRHMKSYAWESSYLDLPNETHVLDTQWLHKYNHLLFHTIAKVCTWCTKLLGML